MHGEDMTCMGYLFGSNERVCYLSDISRMLPQSLDVIHRFGDIDLLIVDVFTYDGNYPTHFNLIQCIELVKMIRPKKVLAIGISNIKGLSHDDANEFLKSYLLTDDIDIQLSFDGMKVSLEL
jgi:phosphoribosyl 1,2-cyclic phosphodiesterase